ncbi:MAG: tripartite tricarboxylate transporter substrate-binding protein [Xanthobacteraceae bacterium]
MRALQLALVGALLMVGPAQAQNSPPRVITIVVPLPPGGATDALARTLAEHMRTRLGHAIIVENVPGAGGTLGVARVVRAAPDGSVLTVGNWATHMASAATYQVPYELPSDLTPIAKLADTPLWMVANNALPARDLTELIGWLRANPDKASAGIVGMGSGGHICGLSFQQATGVRYQFVPYRGGAPAMQDLVAGQIDFMCDMAANSLPQVRAGTIKPLAVMSQRRWFAAPDVPTTEEMGVPGLALSIWHGLWGPRGTPADVVSRINGAVVAALADPVVGKRFAELGQEVAPAAQQTPAGFAAFYKGEIEKWWPVIRGANVKAE